VRKNLLVDEVYGLAELAFVTELSERMRLL
jgi:hypothetical protein